MTQRYILGPIAPCTEIVLHYEFEGVAYEFECLSETVTVNFDGRASCFGCTADATDRYTVALIPAPETKEERFIRKVRNVLDNYYAHGGWNGYLDNIDMTLWEYDNDEG